MLSTYPRTIIPARKYVAEGHVVHGQLQLVIILGISDTSRSSAIASIGKCQPFLSDSSLLGFIRNLKS